MVNYIRSAIIKYYATIKPVHHLCMIKLSSWEYPVEGIISENLCEMPLMCSFISFSVKKLIQSGINPDVKNEDGLTALHQVRYYFKIKKSISLIVITIFTSAHLGQ